jgi:exodeoxyribonuclease VII large subunit
MTDPIPAETGAQQRFPEAITVTQLNEYVKRLIDSSAPLANVYVKGEISNFKNHYGTGHYYFSLKDDGAVIAAVMFRSSAVRMPFVPENGMKVVVHGRVSAFVRDGKYQLYADTMEPDGVGALYVAFEQLKRRLAAEGLFDTARKKTLPKVPTRIGIITSATGAAVRDMIRVAGRRFPYAKLTLYPALVQGPDAPAQLIAGVEYFNRTRSADVIILGRGGGSMEDLWAFNDEGLARAVAASAIPIISAVGHETDFTICDFAADCRAPTPSAAAELALPDNVELRRKINNLIGREAAVLLQSIARRRETLARLASARPLQRPQNVLDDRRMQVSALAERLGVGEEHRIALARARLEKLAGKMDALNPLSVLARGFGAVYAADGTILKSARAVRVGDKVTFRLSDGEADASVLAVRPDLSDTAKPG